MSEKIIALKIRNGEPLKVPKSLLTEDSRMFRYLIDELNYNELEMDDFSTEAVNLFLELLPTKEVKQIEEVLFRELHKMAVVFEVQWLKFDCRNWLHVKISSITNAEDKEFVFEECWYIFKKWKDRNLMNELIFCLRHQENSPLISRYLSDIEKLETEKIDLLLDLGGSNIELFLRCILDNLNKQKKLGCKVKYMVENINLALAFEQNEELYLGVFDTITNLRDISVAELRFCHKLRSETMRSVYSRKEKISHIPTTMVYDRNNYNDLINSCRSLGDIATELSNDRVTSMYVVVELLLSIFLYSTPEDNETKLFVSTLEFMSSKKRLHKISREYLRKIIAALSNSRSEKKEKLLVLLEEINCKENLSTEYRDSVIVKREQEFQLKPKSKKKKKRTVTQIIDSQGPYQHRMYTFKHPATSCSNFESITKSKCGFMLKISSTDDNSIIELYKEDSIDYSINYFNLNRHCHDIISASEMFWYFTETATVDNCEITVAGRWMWWKEWLDHIDQDCWTLDNDYVAYNVAGFLVTK